MGRKSDEPAITRRGRATFAYVPVPSEPGRWFCVPRCVIVVACPKCGAPKREPCLLRRRSDPLAVCPRCRRVHPIHRATACKAREDAYRRLGGNVYPERVDHTRCAACKSTWPIDPATAVCPNCHAPRTTAAHYAGGPA